jgi:hypothetical protein
MDDKNGLKGGFLLDCNGVRHCGRLQVYGRTVVKSHDRIDRTDTIAAVVRFCLTREQRFR